MGERIALAEPYARARGKDDDAHGAQFEHVLKAQSPHVSVEMCGPPSRLLPAKPGGTQSESSSVAVQVVVVAVGRELVGVAAAE